MLLYLASRPGQVCSKDEIIRSVWTDTFVTDEALWHCISQLRKIFGDDARQPRHIETVYKRGYRLVAPVETIADETVAVEQFAAGVWTRGLLALGLMLAVGILVVVQPFRADSSPSARLVITPLTSFSGLEIDPAISPDGRQLAFAWNQDLTEAHYDIYIQVVGQNNPFRLTNNEAMDYRPAWSPDGSQVAFARKGDDPEDRGVFIVSALGGPERRLAGPELGHIFNLIWSPDGRWLAVSSTMDSSYQYRISLLSPETGEVRPLTTPPAGSVGDRDPAFSADGRYLAFRRTLLASSDDLYWTCVDDSGGGRLSYDNAQIVGITWHGTTSVLFSSDRVQPRSLWRAAFPSGRLSWVPMGDEFAVDPVVAANSGRLVYQRLNCDANIWELDLSDDQELSLTPLLSSTRVERSPEYSPDGRRIAFVSNRSGQAEVWLADASGSGSRRITSFNGPNINRLRWSPDGRTLVFDVLEGGQADLYLVDVDAGVPRQLTDTTYSEISPAWAADGGSIYFGSDRGGSWDLWRQRLSDGAVEQVTTSGGFVGTEDVAGEFVYFLKRGEPGLWRLSLADGSEECILDDVMPHDGNNWTVTRDGIYFVRAGAPFRARQLVFHDLVTGAERTLLDAVGPTMYPGLAVSPDGRSILMVRMDSFTSDIMLAENFE